MEILGNIFGGVMFSALVYFFYERFMEERKAKNLHKEKRMYEATAIRSEDTNYMQVKTFSVREAINGQYITFHKHKYNPNGPDINEQCVYLVKDDEPLIDAIAVVLVLMNKEE